MTRLRITTGFQGFCELALATHRKKSYSVFLFHSCRKIRIPEIFRPTRSMNNGTASL
jgi:hypothetical protein